MSRHITALAAVVVLTAGGAAAATVITANDDGARTITITSDDGVGIRRATDSLDKLIAKGAKVA